MRNTAYSLAELIEKYDHKGRLLSTKNPGTLNIDHNLVMYLGKNLYNSTYLSLQPALEMYNQRLQKTSDFNGLNSIKTNNHASKIFQLAALVYNLDLMRDIQQKGFTITASDYEWMTAIDVQDHDLQRLKICASAASSEERRKLINQFFIHAGLQNKFSLLKEICQWKVSEITKPNKSPTICDLDYYESNNPDASYDQFFKREWKVTYLMSKISPENEALVAETIKDLLEWQNPSWFEIHSALDEACLTNSLPVFSAIAKQSSNLQQSCLELSRIYLKNNQNQALKLILNNAPNSTDIAKTLSDNLQFNKQVTESTALIVSHLLRDQKNQESELQKIGILDETNLHSVKNKTRI